MREAVSREESAFAVHVRVVSALLRREMATRYGRSAGGYAWALVEPVGVIALLSVAWGFLMRSPSLGDSFVVFFATGYLAFNFYRTTADTLAGAISGNSALLKYPTVNAFDVVMARLILQSLTNAVITFVILVAAIRFTGQRVQIDPVALGLAVGAATLLAFGAGMCNAVLFQVYPVWQRVWGIVNRPLMIISGIFYIPEDLPRPALDLLWYNPLAHVTSVFRSGFYGFYRPVLDDLAYPALLGVAALMVGLMLRKRFDERLGDL